MQLNLNHTSLAEMLHTTIPLSRFYLAVTPGLALRLP